MTKGEYLLLGFFALLVLTLDFVTWFAWHYELIPFLVALFVGIASVLALWSISFYIGVHK